MNDMILLKQGEIVLKGLNRHTFEAKLIGNVKRRLERFGRFRIYAVQSIVYVEPKNEDCDMDGAFEAVQKIFGIVSVSRAMACKKDKDAMYETAKEYLASDLRMAKSFKVEAKRSDKSFPMTSIQLSQYVGGLLSDDFPDTKVDVHTPELTVMLEVRDNAAYVHGSPVPGAGGMPLGANGSAVSLLSGGIDSPVSTYMAAKRGVSIVPVHFFSFPYTSEQAKEKVIELAKLLVDYCGRMTLHIIPFTHIQEEIHDKCPEEFFTIIMRRFMMRLSERVAKDWRCSALITGENLGQVASQTMEAMAVTEAVVSTPILRPLICLDKSDIVIAARKLGTFDTSILPYEDCCTVFTPRHPRTHPHLDEVEAAESVLDVDALVEEAYAGIEKVRIQR